MLGDDTPKDFREPIDPILEKEAQLFEELVSLPEANRKRLLEAVKGFGIIEAAFDAKEGAS